MKVKDILKEDDFADLGLKGHGSDLDKDQYDKDYDTPMIAQLGKILDSKGNENPITHVTTLDGSKIKVNFDQASVLKQLLQMGAVNGLDKQNQERFRDDIQTKAGLVPFLDVNDGKSMQMLYLEKYGEEKLKVMRRGGNRL